MKRYFNGSLKYRKVFIYAILTAVLCGLFLFSPRPVEEYCGNYITLSDYASFPLNCDSYDYVEVAKQPSRLFEKESIRQSRPFYVILAGSLGYVLSPIFSVLPLSKIAAQDALLASPFYWAFMLLNFLFLVGSLLLFDRIADVLTENKFPQFLKYVLGVFLISNVVIKTSFWSAHQQMLTIFSPLLCVYLVLNIVLSEELSYRKVFLISGIGGFLLLAYGNFLVFFAAILLAITIQLVRAGSFLNWRTLKLVIPAFLLFTLPTLIWCGILIAVNGRVYNHEVLAYRQFVWIFDKLSISFNDFYEQLTAFTMLYGISIYRAVLIFLVGLFLIKIYNSVYFLRNKSVSKPNNYLLFRNVLILLLTLYLLFFWVMGYYGERLTFTMVPVVLCLSVLELNILLTHTKALTVKVVFVLLLFSTFFWIYSSVTAYGPFRDLSRQISVKSLQSYI